MLESLKETIIRFLGHDTYTPLKLGKLARELGITTENYPLFKQAFDELHAAGHVVIGHGNSRARGVKNALLGISRTGSGLVEACEEALSVGLGESA